MLRLASPLDVTKPGRLRDLLRTCTERWPRLRATAETAADAGDAGDFRLIPRAMQAEEDLLRAIDDYQVRLWPAWKCIVWRAPHIQARQPPYYTRY